MEVNSNIFTIYIMNIFMVYIHVHEFYIIQFEQHIEYYIIFEILEYLKYMNISHLETLTELSERFRILAEMFLA